MTVTVNWPACLGKLWLGAATRDLSCRKYVYWLMCTAADENSHPEPYRNQGNAELGQMSKVPALFPALYGTCWNHCHLPRVLSLPDSTPWTCLVCNSGGTNSPTPTKAVYGSAVYFSGSWLSPLKHSQVHLIVSGYLLSLISRKPQQFEGWVCLLVTVWPQCLVHNVTDKHLLKERIGEP